jgi:hypothetical protein
MNRLVIEGVVAAMLALGANGCERDAFSSERRLAANGRDGGMAHTLVATNADTRDGGWRAAAPLQFTGGAGGMGGSGGMGGLGGTGGTGGIGPTGGTGPTGGAGPTGGTAPAPPGPAPTPPGPAPGPRTGGTGGI